MEIELSSGTLADLHPSVGAKRGLVIAPDIQGRRPLFDEMAARLSANNRWHVVVVDPFRNRPFATDDTEKRCAAMSDLDDDEVVGDLVDAANRLEVEPVGLLGFCIGGMYALKGSASHRFDKLVSVYGMIRVPEQWRGSGQREPLQLLQHAEDPADILAMVGTDDPFTPPEDVDLLESAGVEVVRYPKAEHGFVHDPSRHAHRPKAAADVWKRTLSHLTI